MLIWDWLRMSWGRYAYPIKVYKKWKRTKDKRVAERKSLERFWIDVICQAGENAVHAGQYSREQINQWYDLFGKGVQLTGLLPKHRTVKRKDLKDLKKAIIKRIGPEARAEFKSKKTKLSAKVIRARFRRAFRNTEHAA